MNTLLNNYTNIVSEATARSQVEGRLLKDFLFINIFYQIELFETGKFSDFILKCEGVDFKVCFNINERESSYHHD